MLPSLTTPLLTAFPFCSNQVFCHSQLSKMFPLRLHNQTNHKTSLMADIQRPLVIFFDGLNQFGDTKLQSADTRSLHHHPTENAHKANPMARKDKNNRIHDLI